MYKICNFFSATGIKGYIHMINVHSNLIDSLFFKQCTFFQTAYIDDVDLHLFSWLFLTAGATQGDQLIAVGVQLVQELVELPGLS